MKRSLTISIVAHVIVLLCALVAISAQPMDAPPVDAMPVDFISSKDFTQMTQGVKNAPKPKIDDPKPLADKIGAPTPPKQQADKVANKPDITTDAAAPKSQPKPDPKPADKPAKEAKADPKPADKPQKPKTPDVNFDQIADLLKKDANKQPTKPQDAPTTRDAPKFDADQVAALLDKRDPQRQVASAAQLNSNASLGDQTGQAAQLSQSEIDGLRARIVQCWSPPPGVDADSRIYIVLRTLFKQDGSLAQEPVLVEGSPSPLGPALAESAKRALLSCQPFTMLRPEHYQEWKDIELKFDPHEMLGG